MCFDNSSFYSSDVHVYCNKMYSKVLKEIIRLKSKCGIVTWVNQIVLIHIIGYIFRKYF